MTSKSKKTALIIGLPGIGKSTLAQELHGMGRQAIDTDTVKGLGRWSCLAGHSCRPYRSTKLPPLDKLTWDIVNQAFGSFEVSYQPHKAWRDKHTYKWGIDAMQRTIDVRDRRTPLYVIGTASNASGMFNMFDVGIILTVSSATLERRLRLRAQNTTAPYAFTCDTETMAAFEQSLLLDKALSGATPISAEPSPVRVASSVIEMVES